MSAETSPLGFLASPWPSSSSRQSRSQPTDGERKFWADTCSSQCRPEASSTPSRQTPSIASEEPTNFRERRFLLRNACPSASFQQSPYTVSFQRPSPQARVLERCDQWLRGQARLRQLASYSAASSPSVGVIPCRMVLAQARPYASWYDGSDSEPDDGPITLPGLDELDEALTGISPTLEEREVITRLKADLFDDEDAISSDTEDEIPNAGVATLTKKKKKGNKGSVDGLLDDDAISMRMKAKKPGPRTEHWDQMFAKLLEYKQRHGDFEVPRRPEGPEFADLGPWVKKQRSAYAKGTLSEKRRERLHSVGFTFITGRRAKVLESMATEWSRNFNGTRDKDNESESSFYWQTPKDTSKRTLVVGAYNGNGNGKTSSRSSDKSTDSVRGAAGKRSKSSRADLPKIPILAARRGRGRPRKYKHQAGDN